MKLSPSVFAAVIGTLSLMPVGASAANFAGYVVSSSGLSTNSLFNDPAAALGQPTTLDNDSFGDPVYHACMVNPAFGQDANTGQNLLVKFANGTAQAPATGQLTVQLSAPITHTANSWYGQDFIVYSNQFFIGASQGDVSDGTDMSAYQLADRFTSGPLPQVSVSQDGVTFYAVSPSSSVAYPENPYHWDGISANNSSGWGALNDFSKPVNPALTAADFANQTVAYADNTLYDGSAGGTPYTFTQTGLTTIDYIRFSANPDTSGVVDGVAAVGTAAPEPAQASALILMGLGLSGRLWQARRRSSKAQ